MGLTYQWTGTGGAAFTNSTLVTPGLTLPALLSASSAVYTLTLVVTDGLNQPSDPVMVTLNIDRPVMADAGVDQTATTGRDVTLNGGASVNHALASADPLTYSWMQTDGSPTVALTNETTSMPTFTAPTAPTVLTFNLTVSGSYNSIPSGSTNADTVTVTVAIPTVNQRPTAEAGDAQSVAGGGTVTLDGSASSDLDGDDLIYLWTQPLDQTVALTNEATSMATFTAPDVMTGTINLTFNLTVTDPDGLNHVDTVTIAVNAAPTANITVVEASTLLSFTAPAFGFLAGETVTVTVNGANSTDPALMGLTYQWTGTGGAAFTNSTLVTPGLTLPALLPASSAVYTLTLVVTDGLNQPSEPVMVMLNIDRPVMADAGVDQTATTGGDVTLNGGASVNHALASADPLTYSWMQTDGSPTVALTNANTSMPTFTAPTAPTVLTFNLTVSGSYNSIPSGSTNAATVTVTVAIPTVANAGGDKNGEVGTSVFVSGSGTGGTPPYVYLWEHINAQSDENVTLNSPDAFVPGLDVPSDFPVGRVIQLRLTVTDANGLSDTDIARITTQGPAPTANAGTNDSVDEGASFTLTGSGTGTPPLTYAWTQVDGTPTVTLINPDTADPTFIAPELLATTDLTFQLTVTSGTQSSAPSEVTITVNADNDPPTVEAGNAQTVNEGDSVGLFGSGTDQEGQSLTYLWTQTGVSTVVLMGADTANPTFIAPEAPR